MQVSRFSLASILVASLLTFTQSAYSQGAASTKNVAATKNYDRELFAGVDFHVYIDDIGIDTDATYTFFGAHFGVAFDLSNKLFIAGKVAAAAGLSGVTASIIEIQELGPASTFLYDITPSLLLRGDVLVGRRLGRLIRLYGSASFLSLDIDNNLVSSTGRRISNDNPAPAFSPASSTFAFGFGIDFAPKRAKWGIDYRLFEVASGGDIATSASFYFRF